MKRAAASPEDKIALEFERIANDPSIPGPTRAAARKALAEWRAESPGAREKAMQRFLADLELDLQQFGPEAPRRPRLGRPPQGALPAVDDAPFVPPRRRRMQK